VIRREERKKREGQEIECPKCGRTMEEGYIIGPRGIYWSKNSPLYDITMGSSWRYSLGIPSSMPGAEPLGFSQVLLRGGAIPRLKAYRCFSCNVIYFDLNDQVLNP